MMDRLLVSYKVISRSEDLLFAVRVADSAWKHLKDLAGLFRVK